MTRQAIIVEAQMTIVHDVDEDDDRMVCRERPAQRRSGDMLMLRPTFKR